MDPCFRRGDKVEREWQIFWKMDGMDWMDDMDEVSHISDLKSQPSDIRFKREKVSLRDAI